MAHNVFSGNKREQSRLIFKALSVAGSLTLIKGRLEKPGIDRVY